MDATLSLVFTSLVVVAILTWSLKLLNWAWFTPNKLEKCLRQQGLDGNPYRLIVGDMRDMMKVNKQEQYKPIAFSDDLMPHSLPYLHQIMAKYGENSFVWFGPCPTLNVMDPELIREILSKPDVYQKPGPDLFKIIVGGLLFLEGDKWFKHRKIINPAFHLSKLKNMIPAISLSCSEMMEKWESSCDQGSTEIDVQPCLQYLSGDVISRTAFGSSYEEGRRIFQLQREQVDVALKILPVSFLPGWRYLPTKQVRRLKAITKEMESFIRDIINKRENAVQRGESYGDDLLGILMESNSNEIQERRNKVASGMSIEDVVEECKLFYFAGSETTATLILWTMVLLSKHTEWQGRARQEVLQVFGNKEPTSEGLNRLKIVTMILQEVLRLYPSVTATNKITTKPAKLGKLTLPAGVQMMMLIGCLHRDQKIWGDDANEFNPERFSEGTFSATRSQCSFIPFGNGPRACIGQNLAMIEAKIVMAMILQRFSFELSPSYLHAPFQFTTLQPQHGAPLVIRKL